MLSHLLWRTSQRAQYLADYRAAQVAGTSAVLDVLDALHLDATVELVTQRTVATSTQATLFADLRQRVAALPSRELERLRRVARLEESRLDATHPPTGLHIALLEARPVQAPTLSLSALQGRALQEELRSAETAM